MTDYLHERMGRGIRQSGIYLAVGALVLLWLVILAAVVRLAIHVLTMPL